MNGIAAFGLVQRGVALDLVEFVQPVTEPVGPWCKHLAPPAPTHLARLVSIEDGVLPDGVRAQAPTDLRDDHLLVPVPEHVLLARRWVGGRKGCRHGVRSSARALTGTGMVDGASVSVSGSGHEPRAQQGGPVRILVTNDDGVRAPGIAALALVAARSGHDVVVVAPMVDYSGSGAAVGPVHSRHGVDYESHTIEGVDVPTFGIDGPPALAVILACVGGFGARPDVVLSGINHGINVGRSALHSGTIGAALTAAHFGLRSLAVSIRFGADPVPWEAPASLAAELIPVLFEAEAGTTLNLNVPNVPLSELRGFRAGRLGHGGVIRSAVQDTGGGDVLPHFALPTMPSGTLRLDLSPPGSNRNDDPDTDSGLLAQGYASITALRGVRDAGADADGVVAAALDALYGATGVEAGPPPGDAPGDAPDDADSLTKPST